MADLNLPDLTELNATPADADELYIIDKSDTTDGASGTNKKITRTNLVGGLQAEPTEGAFVDGDKTKLDGIEASADVTDETNVTDALDGATLTAATVATGDKVLIQDADDSDNLKTVTAQSIADLGGGGGGGGYTPKHIMSLDFAVNPTSSADGSVDFTTSGTGSIAEHNSGGSARIESGTTSTGYGKMNVDHNYYGNGFGFAHFDYNPTGVFVVGFDVDTAGDGEVGIHMGSDISTAKAAYKSIGFYMESSGGAATVYAYNSDSTTETRTDITSDFTYTGNQSVPQVLAFQMDSGTDIKFYVNGTLAATHTTNLPTGGLERDTAAYAYAENDGGTRSQKMWVHNITTTFDAF